MEKMMAYKFTLTEAEEALQDCLDDKGIKLVSDRNFYHAESDSTYLDGSEVDKRLAHIIGVKNGEHYETENGLIFLVSQ